MATKAAVIWQPCKGYVFLFDSQYIDKAAIERHIQPYSQAFDNCEGLGRFLVISYSDGRTIEDITRAMDELPQDVVHSNLGQFKDFVEDSFKYTQKAMSRKGNHYTISQVATEEMAALGFSTGHNAATIEDFEASIPF